ncbi:MAG TPA: DinB family protein [Terriglobia bacterium]|nr:DinB family protein [Terriglobia bacterium]
MPPPEVWLRGPLPQIPDLVQPVAHALLQAREEVENLMANFDEDLLWTRPGGVASAGFHLQHLTGVLDRLFTYARGEQLDAAQLSRLQAEGRPESGIRTEDLVATFREQVDRALEALRRLDVKTLTDSRVVGRGKLPSTVLGLLVHSAEHVQRHVGQLLVTVRIQQSALNSSRVP